MYPHGSTPMLNLSPTADSFPFKAKSIPLNREVKVTLGSEATDNATSIRRASTTNGLFARINSTTHGDALAPILPLSLSSSHSEVWWDGHQMYIRDMDSPFGTFVNDIKIKNNTLLRNGDIISLGTRIPRNINTPSYITNEQLKPVIAKVTLIGIASS